MMCRQIRLKLLSWTITEAHELPFHLCSFPVAVTPQQLQAHLSSRLEEGMNRLNGRRHASSSIPGQTGVLYAIIYKQLILA